MKVKLIETALFVSLFLPRLVNVSLQVTSVSEGLAAHITHKGSLTGVDQIVSSNLVI